MNQIKKLKLRNKVHTIIVGQTQMGKTYLAVRIFGSKNRAIYIDTKDQPEKFPFKTLDVDKGTDMEKIKKALNQGKKIRYVPSDYGDKKKEAKSLWLFLKNHYNKDVYLFVDEIGEYSKGKDNAFDTIATKGEGKGVYLYTIGQRLVSQQVSNTIMSQSKQFIFFNLQFEEQYLRDYNIPLEPINRIDRKKQFTVYRKGEGTYPKTKDVYKLNG